MKNNTISEIRTLQLQQTQWNETLHPDSSIAKAESDIAKFAENSESWNPCSSI